MEIYGRKFFAAEDSLHHLKMVDFEIKCTVYEIPKMRQPASARVPVADRYSMAQSDDLRIKQSVVSGGERWKNVPYTRDYLLPI